jgi:hypothetical protein
VKVLEDEYMVRYCSSGLREQKYCLLLERVLCWTSPSTVALRHAVLGRK